jgi:DnaJ-class molecular chaperone
MFREKELSSKCRTFYDILEVPSNASLDQIKKSYRKKSLLYHPDRQVQGGQDNTNRFQEISEAYETLSDDRKRKQYDFQLRMGLLDEDEGGGGRFGNESMGPSEEMFEELLQNVFQGGLGPGIRIFTSMPSSSMGGMGGMGGMGETEGFRGMATGLANGFANGFPFLNAGFMGKPTPIIKNITLTMEQVYNGAYLPIEVERWITLEGNKQREKETLYVKIPPGVDENEIIVLQNKGNLIHEQQTQGDVKLILNIDYKGCPFERQGLDLIYNHTISLKESLCGFQFEIKHLDNKVYTLNNNRGNIIFPNHKKTIHGKGLTRENQNGNLVIIFHVEFPSKLNETCLQTLEQIL